MFEIDFLKKKYLKLQTFYYIMLEKQIKTIEFGIYSAQEIKNMSVCVISNTKKLGPGSVYDPLMGTTDISHDCKTCEQNSNMCQGHFGRIELNTPIIHPLFERKVLQYLQCFCFKCNKLIIQREQIELCDILKSKNETRFKKILEKIEKIDSCCALDENMKICGEPKPKIKINTLNNSYVICYNIDKKKIEIKLNTEQIKKIFENISNSDIELLGVNYKMSHPKDFIITILPVLPPCARPYVTTDNNKTCDDDLTNQYIEIVKLNNNLLKCSPENVEKIISSIRFRILTSFNNSGGKAKQTTNGRIIKGIKERLTGKDGQIRNNVNGKRCNQTARTVIGPDPTLRLNELGMPKYIANVLSIPVKAVKYNLNYLQNLVNSGKVKTVIKPDGKTIIDIERYRKGTVLNIGDILIRNARKILVTKENTEILKGDILIRNGKKIEKIKHTNRDYKIDIGWTVNRPLQNGDYVLFNRQPTLHKASMLALKVNIKNYSTFRINLAITKPLNADFDGDECNVHVPASLEAQTELKYLSTPSKNMISYQCGKPNMAIVQDSLLGIYKMTLQNEKLTKEQFFNICMKFPQPPWEENNSEISIDYILKRIEKIKSIMKTDNPFYCKGLISIFLPPYFNYNYNSVKIHKGVLLEGVIDKKVVGACHNSIHQVLYKEYNDEIAMYVLDCIQFVATEYLLIYGFSIGLGDCLISKKANKNGRTKEKQIEDSIKKAYMEAENIKEQNFYDSIKEAKINNSLNKAKDIGLRIAKEALEKDNNFLLSVNSGSKGDFFNIAQITGLLGQQNLKGQRISLSLNNGKRSLSHYSFDNLDIKQKYESQGFIDNSFLRGLNPRQFFFHAMTGREGICDTAMGTSISGYAQRKIVKLTEDIKIQTDGTVRDVAKNIYQLSYGDDNLDPSNTIKIKENSEISNVKRIIEKLNTKQEDFYLKK